MPTARPRGVLGVLGAMDVEVEAIEAALTGAQSTSVLGCTISQGTIDGHALLVCRSGIGKVNAALATAAMAAAGADALVFVGVAGSISPTVKLGDAVVATDLVQHDVDITAFGHKPGTFSGLLAGGVADPTLSQALADAATSLGATVHRGRIASGDQFIASPQRGRDIAATFDAIAVEMEGAAVAQACTRLRLPFAVLRWISDGANDSAATDFGQFVHHIAQLDLAIVAQMMS